MRNHFLKHICEKRLTGVGYAVCINGEEKCREILGFSDCVQQRPLPSDAIFRLASMTKPITAIAVMICKERGLLDLDTPISTYIDFAHGGVGEVKDGETVFKESAREITLRDILTHSSGLGSGNVGSAQTKEKKQPEKLEKNVAWWKGKLLDFAPGSHAAYSGVVAFEVAAFVVEKVSGKPFDVFLYSKTTP